MWHPFTQMREYLAAEPLVVERAEGNYLIDDRGRRLFDGTSALWCNLLGHRVPEIDAAVTEQLGRFAHTTLLGTTHPAVAELARRLVEIAPSGLNHVFFSDNGATAVEAALKMAFQYRLLTQGKEAAQQAVYLSLGNAYHGDTLGAAAVGGVELFHDIFKPILLPSLKTPSPYCYRCPIGKTPTDCSIDCADELEQALRRANGRVCAVILEPGVQAAAGMLTLPRGFLSRTAEACRAHGALLILDEVATGFGRTGTMFACQREGVTPDLMCVAKGLTGGYLPVAATLQPIASTTRSSAATTNTATSSTATRIQGTRSAAPRRSRRSGCCRTAPSSAQSSRRRECCTMPLRHLRRIRHVGDDSSGRPDVRYRARRRSRRRKRPLRRVTATATTCVLHFAIAECFSGRLAM